MQVETRVPAVEGMGFGPNAFDSSVGKVVRFGDAEGICVAATVAPNGTFALVTLDVPDGVLG